MNTNGLRRQARRIRNLVLVLITLSLPSRAELQLPVLKSGTVVYSNVTVYSQTEQDVYIRHAQGLGNVKISTLDNDSRRALGLKVVEPEKTTSAKASAMVDSVKEQLGSFSTSLQVAAREPGKFLPAALPREVLYGILAGVVLFYFFTCFCLGAICRNAGSAPGVAIWIPIAQIVPLIRAARMPTWTILLFLLPGVNLIAGIWWSLRIATACGKGSLVGILLCLPITNVFAFLYLAFSKGNPAEEITPAGPVKLDGLAGA